MRVKRDTALCVKGVQFVFIWSLVVVKIARLGIQKEEWGPEVLDMSIMSTNKMKLV